MPRNSMRYNISVFDSRYRQSQANRNIDLKHKTIKARRSHDYIQRRTAIEGSPGLVAPLTNIAGDKKKTTG